MEIREDEVASFWQVARFHARLNSVPSYFGPTPLESVPPPAWWFGGTPEEAEALASLVVDGTKTATAGALWDYEENGEDVPEPGTLGIVVDGRGRPRALISVTRVDVVDFDEVDEEHARLEGEGDLSLSHWREVHQRFFTDHATHDRGFAEDMPVVLERFAVLHTA